ncbi:hypothetical protein LJR084_000380 [Variovorax sp. LjRoot84]|uniref:shikimate kinase n=1 Tax=Variovorax sp. LjRoot84 TaxID=3342340 RepID=UPI003ECD7419
MIPVVHLVGPGGAGKTSVGISLAGRLGWHFVDLDQCFMACEGDITAASRHTATRAMPGGTYLPTSRRRAPSQHPLCVLFHLVS